MDFFCIETERLLLRKLTPETYQYIFEQYSDLEQLEFLGIGTFEKLKEEKEKFTKGITTYNKSTLVFQLLDKKSKKVIGGCGFHTWYLDHARAEIGYALTDDTIKRSGLMSEALKPIIAYGFEEMKLNRIEAFIGPNNSASIRLVEKFGFTREGLLRQHYYKDGQFEDSVAYSLLQEEYNNE